MTGKERRKTGARGSKLRNDVTMEGKALNRKKNNTSRKNMKNKNRDAKKTDLGNKFFVYGRNIVEEALIHSAKYIEKIYFSSKKKKTQKRIEDLAISKGFRPEYIDEDEMAEFINENDAQGCIAVFNKFAYSTIDDALRLADSRGEKPLVLVLDRIEDPRNLGAIIRTARCAGVHGIIIAKDRAAGITPTVAKVSEGAIFSVPCIMVTNLVAALKDLKQKGFWVYAADASGASCFEQELEGSVALVLGNEGRGISKLCLNESDYKISIPMVKGFNSLNVSVAAGILMYEVARKNNIL